MNDRYIAIWEFEIDANARTQFEQIYGPDGGWAQLFRRSSEYLGTRLMRSLDHPERYLTLDLWTSRSALETFKQEYAAEYARLDKECERLTRRETRIGEFMEEIGIAGP